MRADHVGIVRTLAFTLRSGGKRMALKHVKYHVSLRGPGVSTSVTSEGLEVLAKVLVELREGDLGSAFNAISEQCRAFFDNVSPHWCLAWPWPSWGSPRMAAR